MSPRPALALLLALPLAGCFPNGEWIPTIWGGEGIDDASAPELAGTFITDDDCTATLDAFVVASRGGALLTPEGTASAILPPDQLFDLVQPGPHSMASIVLERGIYPELALVLGPADTSGDTLVGRGQLIGVDNAASDANPIRGNASPAARSAMQDAGASALIQGSLTCGDTTVALDVLVDDVIGLLRCPADGFEIPGGSFGVTEFVVHAESLIRDGAQLIALATDGVVTMQDLAGAGLDDDLRDDLHAAWETEGGACTWESGEAQ